MNKKSFRVYLIRHHTGHFTAILLRTWDWIFDRPPPSAYGVSEDDVLAQLEIELAARAATGEDPLDRYLWDESFTLRAVAVDVHPQTSVKKTTVIGKRLVPLRIAYLWSKTAEGAFRIVVPRFGWRFVVEDLAVAPSVLENAVTTALLGEAQGSLYDFRSEGDEHVREWSPRILESKEAFSPGGDVKYSTVAQVSDELVDRAARGKLPMVVGFSPDFEEAAQLYGRSPPASILLVGPPGVGKTTWVNRLARRFLQWRREKPKRRSPDIYSTSADRIIAGMAYLGMWQERCLAMVDELSGEGEYLHVGALLPLLRPQPDGSSIAEILTPAIRDGELSVIAECTEEELTAASHRAASLVASFRIVRIHEPKPAEVPALLDEYEMRRDARVRLHPAGKKRLVHHLSMFRRDLAFPGKAFKFYDYLAQEAEGAARAENEEPVVRTYYPRDVSEAYARYSGLPIEIISDDHPAGAAVIAERLKRRVIGQEHACEAAARVLARFKANLSDPERPAGVLFFVGPTGVGKTELAKELTRSMFGDEKQMIRLDMSEYMLPGSTRRLLATERGSSSLAQRVRQQPLCLVLLDEIDKADPEVFDLLLGVLGEGRLTDEDGRFVDFRMAVIVMTSNLGVADTPSVGFGGGGRETSLRAVREHFRPELWNRLDHVIPFRGLDREHVLRIVDLELEKAAARTGLVRRNLRLSVLPEARARLAELGFHPTRGARPLKRVVEELVIVPIAARMAADAGYRDREIVVAAREDGRIAVG